MKHKFKVGDVIEATDSGRRLRGIIRYIDTSTDWADLCVEVMDTDEVTYCGKLHSCVIKSIDHVPSGKGWFVAQHNATLAKSYVINKILSEI